MASTSAPPAGKPCHARSISLPARSHPLSVRVEEGLRKLKSWAASALPPPAFPPSAELLCAGLQALEEMYECAEELLRLPHTRRALARRRHEKWAAEESESSVRLLDACEAARAAAASIKERAQGLQSALRTRRAADASAGREIRAFLRRGGNCLRLPEAPRHLAVAVAADHQDLSLATRALKELGKIAAVLFRSVAALMSKPARKWLPSSLSGAAAAERGAGSELERADASLRGMHGKHLKKDVAAVEEKVEEAQRRLQELEAAMSSLEAGLESMFRRLIKNRVSLLNIFSL